MARDDDEDTGAVHKMTPKEKKKLAKCKAKEEEKKKLEAEGPDKQAERKAMEKEIVKVLKK